MRIVIIFFFSIVYVQLQASVQDSVGVVQKDGIEHIEYLVSPGETIYRISTNYGVSISRLMEINPELENGLKAGQVLLIPNDGVTRPNARPEQRPVSEAVVNKKETNSQGTKKDVVVHEVQNGETLYSLSKKYNVSVGELLKWNGLELKPGQKLVVGYKKSEPKKHRAKDTDIPQPVNKETGKPEVEIVRAESETMSGETYTVYDYDKTRQQVLIVPFDPHLYFSDADDEIAKQSNIPRIKVRDVFRRRLSAMLAPQGYESIYLLGGRSADTLTDLNKIYSSVSYNYQEILYSDSYVERTAVQDGEVESKSDDGLKSWINKQKKKLSNPQNDEEAHRDKFKGKYFGVKVNDPRLFTYLSKKYDIDYVIFINQFEVITDYDHCLDRTTGNYERYFIAHFSIFDQFGNLIAGNKHKIHYNSNSNDVSTIVADNMLQIADRILMELPPAR